MPRLPAAERKAALVDAAMAEFGGYDSVFIRTAWHGGKNILEETPENMQLSYEQNCLAVMYALQAVLPPLVDAGGGQVVVQTSATEQGQGAETVVAQVAASAFGVPLDRVRVISGDTETVPYGGGTWASRGAGIGDRLDGGERLRRDDEQGAVRVDHVVTQSLKLNAIIDVRLR